jgi:putative membrane protein
LSARESNLTLTNEEDLQMGKLLKRASILVAATGISVPANAQMYGGYDGWGWGHMIYGPLMMIIFWGGLIVVAVLAVRWLGGGSSHKHSEPPSRGNALDILKERFARGEIDKEEFEERKRLLSD